MPDEGEILYSLIKRVWNERRINLVREQLLEISKNSLEADEILHEVFIHLRRKVNLLREVNHRDALDAYLRTSVKRKMLSMMRPFLRRRRLVEVQSLHELGESSRRLEVYPDVTVLHSMTSEEVIMQTVDTLAAEFSNSRSTTPEKMKVVLRELVLLSEDVGTSDEEFARLRLVYDSANRHHVPVRRALEVHGFSTRTATRIVAKLRQRCGVRLSA